MIFVKWFFPDYNKDYYIKSLLHNDRGIMLFLVSSYSDNILQMTFENFYSYRNTEESYMLELLGDPDWNKEEGRVFYKIIDSDYLDWFHNSSCNLYKDKNLAHYAIYTFSDCFEIISDIDPVIKVIQPEKIDEKILPDNTTE